MAEKGARTAGHRKDAGAGADGGGLLVRALGSRRCEVERAVKIGRRHGAPRMAASKSAEKGVRSFHAPAARSRARAANSAGSSSAARRQALAFEATALAARHHRCRPPSPAARRRYRMNLEVSANRVPLPPIPRYNNRARHGDRRSEDKCQQESIIDILSMTALAKAFSICCSKMRLDCRPSYGIWTISSVCPPLLAFGCVAPKAIVGSRGGASFVPTGGRGEQQQQQESLGGGRTGEGEPARRSFTAAPPHHTTPSGCRSGSSSPRGLPG